MAILKAFCYNKILDREENEMVTKLFLSEI
jgi:hypothetical protein